MDHDEKKKEVSREQLLQYVKKLKAENAELKKKSARLSSSTFWSHLDEQPPLVRRLAGASLARVLEMRFRLGEFDDAAKNPHARVTDTCAAADKALALQAARESVVLLNNSAGLLPLALDLLVDCATKLRNQKGGKGKDGAPPPALLDHNAGVVAALLGSRFRGDDPLLRLCDQALLDSVLRAPR